MARSESVTDYIANQPAAMQRVLRRVRSVIRKALPDAEEVISYQIPAYRLHGRVVIYFAGWTEHYAIYPANGPVVATFKKELAAYKVTKGTIRFPLSEPVPADLIAGIARLRAKTATLEASKAAVKKAGKTAGKTAKKAAKKTAAKTR